MRPDEKKLVEVAMGIRALHQDLYIELVTALAATKEYHRDMAIQAGVADGGIRIGFARGATEIHRLVADASTLHTAETAKR